MMVSWGLRTASFLAARVPLPIVYAVAAFLAEWIFPLVRRKHRNARENMARVLGPQASPAQVRRLVSAAARNYGRYLADFLRMPYTTREELERRVSVPGYAHVDEALAGGRGAIFVGMHMGSWDVGAAWLAVRGYPVNAVVDTFKHPHLNAFIQSTRTSTGVRIIPVSEAPRRALQVLRRGEALGVLIDRPLSTDGVPVTFFGKTVRLPAGAAALSLRTGAPILAMAVLRSRDATFTGIVSPPIAIEPSGQRRRDIQALTQRVVDELEEMIRRYPDQWYMFRAMWSAQPQDDAVWDPSSSAAEFAQ